jgi:hypothetical protein
MDQVSIKYTTIFHCKTLQNLPKFGFGLKNKPSGNPEAGLCKFLNRAFQEQVSVPLQILFAFQAFNAIFSLLYSFSLLLRFFPNQFPAKAFFSPTHGYTNWDFLNNEYQVQVTVKNRAHRFVNFSPG